MDAMTLFRENIPLIKWVIRNRFGGRSRRLHAEEIYSAGLEALWNCALRYDPSRGVQFSTFAVTSIRLAGLQRLAECSSVHGRRSSYADRFVRKLPERVPLRDHMRSCDNTFNQVDARDEVRHRLRVLSPRAREIVYLRAAMGLDYKVIAERVGVSDVRVAQIYDESVARLRRYAA